MRRTLAMSTAALAAIALAGCGSSTTTSTTTTTTASPTTTTTTTSPTTTTTTAAATTTTAAGTDAAAAGGLTEPGSKLKVGDTATLVFVESGDAKYTVKVKAIEIKKGSQNDLKNVKIDDAALAQATPYFVTMEYTNVSGPAIKNPFLNVKLDARNSGGQRIGSIIIIGSIDACDDDNVDSLEQGKSARECKIFMAPSGSEVASIEWAGDFNTKAVSWTP